MAVPALCVSEVMVRGVDVASTAALQLEVLSTKMRTLGRVALNVGFARKMSVSSLTGSNTAQPASGAHSSTVAASALRVSLARFMRSVPFPVCATAQLHAPASCRILAPCTTCERAPVNESVTSTSNSQMLSSGAIVETAL